MYHPNFDTPTKTSAPFVPNNKIQIDIHIQPQICIKLASLITPKVTSSPSIFPFPFGKFAAFFLGSSASSWVVVTSVIHRNFLSVLGLVSGLSYWKTGIFFGKYILNKKIDHTYILHIMFFSFGYLQPNLFFFQRKKMVGFINRITSKNFAVQKLRWFFCPKSTPNSIDFRSVQDASFHHLA